MQNDDITIQFENIEAMAAIPTELTILTKDGKIITSTFNDDEKRALSIVGDFIEYKKRVANENKIA